MNITWKKLGLTVASASALFLAACEDGTDTTDEDTGSLEGEINLAYVAWDSEIASTNVIGQVLQDVGYEVDLTQLDNAIMWEAVSNGEADAMVSAWLPGTHAPQFEQYSDSLEHLGPNLEGAKIGLVVPEYMDADSIADLTDEADQTITGVEAGAGVVAAAEQAVNEDYANLEDWNVQTSSSGAMIQQLDDAYENEEDIIVTGWSPHWMFQSYDLKYLEDPEGSFGGEETIDTFTREGLEDDMPEAYQILDNFKWEPADMEAVMLEIQDGADPEEAARNWIEENEDTVSEWTEGVIE